MSRYVFSLWGLAAPALCIGLAAVAAGQDEFKIVCAQRSSGVVGAALQCADATITDGGTTITTGVFSASEHEGEFRLSDGVHIVTDQVEFSGDSAFVVRSAGEFVAFEITGSPIRMTHLVDTTATQVSAEAQSIVYDVPSETLQITGDVKFVFGENEFFTCELSYKLDEGSYSTGECGVRATVRQSEPDPDSPTLQRDGP
jgi:lipopolysaccharide transport protein LptA